MSDPDKSGDLYDSDMGNDVTGGSVQIGQTDQQGNVTDHHNVHGTDRHFSWDTDDNNDTSGVHGTEHHDTGNSPW